MAYKTTTLKKIQRDVLRRAHTAQVVVRDAKGRVVVNKTAHFISPYKKGELCV